jgi:hypothetical protein
MRAADITHAGVVRSFNIADSVLDSSQLMGCHYANSRQAAQGIDDLAPQLTTK